MHQQMVLQGGVTHEALAADVAGKGVGVPAMDPQVLIQLVFVPEGLATVGAFKRTETLPDEKVLQRCILTCKRETEEALTENANRAIDLALTEHGKRLIDAMPCSRGGTF